MLTFTRCCYGYTYGRATSSNIQFCALFAVCKRSFLITKTLKFCFCLKIAHVSLLCHPTSRLIFGISNIYGYLYSGYFTSEMTDFFRFLFRWRSDWLARVHEHIRANARRGSEARSRTIKSASSGETLGSDSCPSAGQTLSMAAKRVCIIGSGNWCVLLYIQRAFYY